jgi:hypothetical protein
MSTSLFSSRSLLPLLPVLFSGNTAPILAAATPAPASAAISAATDPAFFEQRIVPILAQNCLKCHSDSDGKVKGGLAMDTREGLRKGGKNGAVITLDKPEQSPLLKRILSTDPDEKMPPKDTALTPAQIADLTAWIKAGALDPRTAPTKGPSLAEQATKAKSHWAFQPVKVTPPPPTKGTWARTPIDQYILAAQQKAGLNPNPEADRSTLIRRAYFDMVGLPPTPAEVQAFVQDFSPNAWEKVVDHLLASPQYGERWGRYWLDVARYSDTKGAPSRRNNEDPRNVDAWSYRDYVINSLNEDRPYDLFIKEQLAADLLTSSTDKSPLAALGFLTVGERFAGNQNDILNDQIDVVSRGFLGLTVACARCHDHMFDPISQKDYYSLHGIFASTKNTKENPVIEMRASQAVFEDYERVRGEALEKIRSQVRAEFAKTTRLFRKNIETILLTLPLERRERSVALRKAGLDVRDLEGLRAAAPALQSEPAFRPFLAFVKLEQAQWTNVAPELWRRIAAGGERFEQVPEVVRAAFGQAQPKDLKEVAALYGKLFAEVEALQSRSVTDDPLVVALGAIPFRGEDSNALSADALIEKLGLRASNAIAGLRAQLDQIDMSHPGAPKRAMAVEDVPKPANSPVLIRGEAGSRGEIVPRRFLEVLSSSQRPEFKLGSGRSELAEAIADPQNPLTARVLVNRVWLHHFGQGIVGTPDDFGVQAPDPTHPELLDYLASEFIKSGWHLKPLHKQILMSAVFRQSSATNAAYATKDVSNKLLWHFNLRRLDFEALRDSLLYIGGRLDLGTIGGQPVNILSEPYSDRRSLYGYIDRAALPELMTHFDFANPASGNGKRHETIVPQQALYLMNSPLMVDVSRRLLARPEMTAATTDAQKITTLYWIIYQRAPKTEELQMAVGFLQELRATKADQPVAEAPSPIPEATPKLTKTKKPSPEAIANALANKRSGGFELQNAGERVERRPLAEWEKFTHALLMANELAYYN